MPSVTVPNQHEVLEAIRHVRQARQYGPQPVTDEELRELLEVARWTGSSRNTQPWHFIAINDKAHLEAISQLRTPINWVASAPLAIAIVLDGDAEVSEAYDEGRVTERLMIAAHVLGLGAGVAWFGDASQQAEAKRILGIPLQHTARSVVVIGHPTSIKDPRPGPARGGRHPLSEVASLNRMGTPVG
jgi:nitroreductase